MAGGKSSSSAFAVLLVDGYNLLAAKVQSSTHTLKSLLVKSTGLGDAWEALIPTGVMQATLTQAGAFFDDAANGFHLAFTAVAQTVSRLVVFAYAGNTFGAEFVGIQGTYGQAYDALGTVGNLTKANVSYQVSGQVDRGQIVQTWTQKTITWNTKTDGNSIDYTLDRGQRPIPITSATKANPCVVTTTVPHGLTTGQKVLISGNTLATPNINSDLVATVLTTTTFSVAVDTTASTGAGTGGSLVLSSTVNGGVGYQEISEVTGPTGFIGKIRHSADDATYVDLIVFTNVTAAPAAERLTVAGTVNRYLCFTGTVTGAGTLTPFCGFSRT